MVPQTLCVPGFGSAEAELSCWVRLGEGWARTRGGDRGGPEEFSEPPLWVFPDYVYQLLGPVLIYSAGLREQKKKRLLGIPGPNTRESGPHSNWN